MSTPKSRSCFASFLISRNFDVDKSLHFCGLPEIKSISMSANTSFSVKLFSDAGEQLNAAVGDGSRPQILLNELSRRYVRAVVEINKSVKTASEEVVKNTGLQIRLAGDDGVFSFDKLKFSWQGTRATTLDNAETKVYFRIYVYDFTANGGELAPKALRERSLPEISGVEWSR